MRACITLDLEPDFGDWVPTAYTAWDDARIGGLLDLLSSHGAPLTAFVVGQSLAARPATVDLFRRRGTEFHLHSFSHNVREPESREEITRGITAFEQAFGHRPIGYRAPQGRISAEGFETLDAEGFLFDSSIFPSFWPAPRYLRFRPEPFRPAGRRLLELPISTLTPLRVIVSLSWINLIGWSAFRGLLSRATLPEPLVFDMHLHDLWDSESYAVLPRPWRWIYRHDRSQGLATLARFLELLQARGFSFSTLGSVARELCAAGASC